MARTYDSIQALITTGFTYLDAVQLRRISMTLHRWHELECGDGNGHIERDEETGKPRYFNDRARYLGANDVRRGYVVADREAGAMKRLGKIMANYPELSFYVQGDPRGAALYILRPGDVPKGESADSYYSRGVVVCK
jgi:hypothetical protein